MSSLARKPSKGVYIAAAAVFGVLAVLMLLPVAQGRAAPLDGIGLAVMFLAFAGYMGSLYVQARKGTYSLLQPAALMAFALVLSFVS
jgi:hypothetical protein